MKFAKNFIRIKLIVAGSKKVDRLLIKRWKMLVLIITKINIIPNHFIAIKELVRVSRFKYLIFHLIGWTENQWREHNEIFRLSNLVRPDDPLPFSTHRNFHMACINTFVLLKTTLQQKGPPYVCKRLKRSRYPARGSVLGRADSGDDILWRHRPLSSLILIMASMYRRSNWRGGRKIQCLP